MNKLLKTVLIVFASLLIICLIVLLLLTTAPGENLIRGWLENQLSAEVGLPVSIKRFETNLWSRVQIETLTISSTTDTEKQPIIYVGQIRIRYSIPQLLGETVTLKELSVDSVILAVKHDSLGRYGIPLLDTPAPTTDESGEKNGILCIDTISLNRMGLFYLDSQLPLSVELAGAVLTAQGNQDGAFSGQLTVGNILAIYDSLALNFENLVVAASLDSESFHLEYAKADCEGLHLEALGDIDISDSKNMTLTVSADGSLDTFASAVAASFNLPPLRASNINAECQIEGDIDDPHLRLVTDIKGLVLQNVVIQSAWLQAQYYDNHLLLDTFQISTLNGTINGNAGTTIDTIGSMTLNMALNGIDLSSLWQTIYNEASPYQGTLNGRIGARGRADDLTSWTIETAVTGRNLKYLKRTISQLEFAARLESGKTGLSLFHGDDTIYADIELTKDSLRGTFEISVPDLNALARFFDQPELTGHLWAQGTIDGSYSNPALHSRVYGSKISYLNFPVDSVFADLSYIDSNVTVIDFICQGRLDSIDSQNPPFDLDSIAGSVTYMGRFRGSLDSLSGNFYAQLHKPQYGSYGLDSLSIKTRLDGSQFRVTELKASLRELDARLSAMYDTLTRAGSFDLALFPLSVPPVSDVEPAQDTIDVKNDFGSVRGIFTFQSHTDLSATVHGQELWLGLLAIITGDTTVSDGKVDFDLNIDGPYMTPDAVFNATIRSLRLSDYQIDSLTTHLRVARDALVLDSLIAYTLGHTLKASGLLELAISPNGYFETRDDARVAAELEMRDFDLSVLEDLLCPEGELSGAVSASLNIAGTTSSPRLDGWLTAVNGRIILEKESSPLENVFLSLTFADSVLTIDSATGSISDIAIRANGSLTASSSYESASINLDAGIGQLGKLAIDGTVSDTNVHLEVLSDSLNLAVFQPFMTELDSLAGRLGCRILIAGQPATPQIDGSLRISALSFLAPRHYAKLSEGYADIRFDRNHVILDSAWASFNGGRLNVSGIIAHDQGKLTDISLTLSAGKITLLEPGIYVMVIDSALLSYEKQQENYVIGGDIVLGEARLTAGLRPTSILPWVKSMETVDFELPELIARSRLNVRIRESDQLWVDNNLARIRLRAELGLIGTPLRPNFTGPLRVEEGYLLYLDRRFRVNEGSVYFNDPVRFNPDINLDASTQVTVYRRTAGETYTVYIKAEGLLDQLQYGLYSEPSLEKTDIVALLTLGATRSELAGKDENNGKGGLTEVLKERAAMLTSQRVSGYISRKAGAIFGFDEFTIQGNLFQFDDSWGPQMVASKRLTQKVDLTYSTTVGHLNDQSVRLGYRLTPRLSLQGETDRQGRAGLDLKYGFTFK